MNRLEERAGQPVARTSRSAGAYRTFHAFVPYEAGLWKHFHALRPLRVALGTSARLVQRLLARIFSKLPCTLIPLDIPDRSRDVADPHDADVDRIASHVRTAGAHLGILVDDDGMRCGFVDERGRLVSSADIMGLLVRTLDAGNPNAAIIVEEDAVDQLDPLIDAVGRKLVASESSYAAISERLESHNAPLAGGTSGRYWFRESFPSCDAVLTIAHVLAALSRNDAEFSEVVNGLRVEG